MTDNPKKYIIHKNKLLEEQDHGLYVSYKEYDIPEQEPKTRWTGPKIPFYLWEEMVAWCQVTQDKFKSEALVFLFLDVNKSEWSAWYLPQITNGMTVQADEDHKDYKNQRKNFPDMQFGSLHHHCTANAFASGTDKADEENREGLHFTVGNLGSESHSLHYRFCIEGQCHEGDAQDVIEYHPSIKDVPDKYRDMVHEEMIKERFKGWDEACFKKQLENVTEAKKFRGSVHPLTGQQQYLIGSELNQTTGGLADRVSFTDMYEWLDCADTPEVLSGILEEYGYKAPISDKGIGPVAKKITDLWDKSYSTQAAADKRDELIDAVVDYFAPADSHLIKVVMETARTS